jgi:hypothetical protein
MSSAFVHVLHYCSTPDPEVDGIKPEEVEAAFVQQFQPFADSYGFPLFSHMAKAETDKVNLCKCSCSSSWYCFY